jgi:ElaB/YqjD/DUF883 family membrane-anchored ribosome-binding protein
MQPIGTANALARCRFSSASYGVEAILRTPVTRKEFIMAQTRTQRESQVPRSFREAGETARRVANDGMEKVRETAGEYWDQGRAKAEELSENIQDQVRERPVAAVLIAASVGFLFGFACALRR